MLISTPHGTLGTKAFSIFSLSSCGTISTPHGTLGTHSQTSAKLNSTFISTPHGTLGTYLGFPLAVFLHIKISTPHGTLGTPKREEKKAKQEEYFNSTRYIRNKLGIPKPEIPRYDFNSTRYIRNLNALKKMPERYFLEISTPHGTLGTLIKHPLANNRTLISTPHGTLGTLSF